MIDTKTCRGRTETSPSATWIGHSSAGAYLETPPEAELVEGICAESRAGHGTLGPGSDGGGARGARRRPEVEHEAELASVEEARWRGPRRVEHTPREFLEEMREHLVEQPDGSWFYRYSRSTPRYGSAASVLEQEGDARALERSKGPEGTWFDRGEARRGARVEGRLPPTRWPSTRTLIGAKAPSRTRLGRAAGAASSWSGPPIARWRPSRRPGTRWCRRSSSSPTTPSSSARPSWMHYDAQGIGWI